MNTTLCEKKDNIKSLGLVLVFVGMQLNTALKNVIPSFDAVAVIMLISFCCLFSLKGFMRLRVDIRTLGLLVFQMVLLLMAIFSGSSSYQLISFHLFLLATAIAFISNDKYIRFEHFGKYMFYVSGFVSLVVFFQATDNFQGLQITFSETGKLWLSQGGDPITLPRALEMNLILCMFYKKENTFGKILAGIFAASDIVGLFSFSNRSTIIVSFALFILWLIMNAKKLNGKKMLKTIAGVILIAIVIIKIPYFSEKVDVILSTITRGFNTLFGLNTAIIDSSVQSRIENLSTAMEAVRNNGTLKTMLLGLGYNYIYLDRPIIQAFLDLGIIGGLLYVLYNIFIPISMMFRTIHKKYVPNDAWIYCLLFAVQTLLDQTITGIPYYFFLWTPTIFLLCSCLNARWNTIKDPLTK